MQGFNMGRYVPPDLEGTVSGNALHAKLPPGRSAAKPGVQTVRFEMPFAIWCSTCPKPTIIGQGVRFNAEKRRTGAYHSTPIWTFRMRHAACGGTIEVATDPQNTAYADATRAALVEFGDHDDDDGDDAGKRAHRTLAKPLFVKAHGGGRREENKIKKSAAGGGTAAATPKSKLLASQRRAGFVSELVGNTRMATDPFLVDAKMSSSSTKMKGLISGIKRKREAAEGADAEQPTRETAQQEAAPPMGLVAYDSESD
ncbi:hypothetical protein VdG2_04451 [Verticillium dahliae VDG2]|nr:hypothetical protein VdG2_04451 [Verticillium dahliae VDG2]